MFQLFLNFQIHIKGRESMKLSNPVPFSVLKNLSEHQPSINSNSSNLCGPNQSIATNFNNSNNNNLPTQNSNVLIAQRSISVKNSSLESLANNINMSNHYSLNNQKEMGSFSKDKKDDFANLQSLQGQHLDHNHISDTNYNTQTYVVRNRSSLNNEQAALCRSSARSESNFSLHKEKKTSVGYKLGKRKLLFEKSRILN